MKGKKEMFYPSKVNTSKGVMYGYINQYGKMVIYPQFDRAGFFSNEGVAVVWKKEKAGVINLKCQYVVKPMYEGISEFKEGMATFQTKTGSGVMDFKGNIITKKEYSFISDFNDEVAMVASTNKDGSYLYGYINNKGQEIVSLKYIEGEEFNNGVALVKKSEGVYERINKKGETLNTYNHEYVDGLKDGLMVFSDNYGGPYGYIDINGNVVMEMKYYTAMEFKDGLAIVSVEKGYEEPLGVINKEGKWVFMPLYANIKILGEGKVALGLDRDKKQRFNTYIYSLGNSRGEVLTDFKYYDITQFEGGIASTYNEKYSFFIDGEGKKIKEFGEILGSGYLFKKEELVYGDIDYNPSYYSFNGKVIYSPNDVIKLNTKTLIKIKKYKPNSDYLVYYPVVSQERCKNNEENINKVLKEYSNLAEISEGEVLDYSYYGDFTVEFYSEDLLVLNLTSYKYPYGAAHGMGTKKTPNINLCTGEFYELSDLFLKNTPWEELLNKIIMDDLEDNPNYEYVYKGVFKGIKKDQDFYVDKNNLYIYYPPYEIAPYAAGFVTFKINFEEISFIINKRGSFYRSFH